MADVAQELLIGPDPGANGALPQRRGGAGRPAGARNKRSLDLARWIEHAFGGMTPGQQAASIALVSPEDLAAAPDAAREVGLVDLGLEPVTLALAVKARRLAKALGCEPFEAWALMAKERDGLMRYVHQVQPAARDAGGAPPATVYLIPEGEVQEVPTLPGEDEQDPDFLELFPNDAA
jgi:hypothetical protein